MPENKKRKPEDFRTLYIDPGEDTGWVVGRDTTLLSGGTMRMWRFIDQIWLALADLHNPEASILNSPEFKRQGVKDEELLGPIGRIVMEDWRLYPDKLKSLQWDQCRTARAIGAITFIARVEGIPVVLQPAVIKPTAVAAGAEELYWRPLRENRHQNDALQHFVFFTQTKLLGYDTSALENIPGKTSLVSDENEVD